MTENIAVVGLGKLGLCLAAVLADAGYKVLGLDINLKVIDCIKSKKSPYQEIGLETLINSPMVIANLDVTNNHEKAVSDAEVIFIVVPTPSLENGKFDTDYITEVAKNIAPLLDYNKHPVVSLVSTVLPGDTRNVLINNIEKYSKMKCGIDFGVCYSPTMIALGEVIDNLRNPNILFIGEFDVKSGGVIHDIYRSISERCLNIYHTNIESAELVKISINVFVTMKMAYALAMSAICEKISGCDVDTILSIVGSDIRVGKNYLHPGISYGGPCFPRDNRAFSSMVDALYAEGIAPNLLSQATDDININSDYIVKDKVLSLLGGIDGKVISILGITYKPNTNIVTDSGALRIANLLSFEGAVIKWFDPADIMTSDMSKCDSLAACLKDSELAIIAVPCNEFRELSPEVFSQNMKTPRILDCWRIFSPRIFVEENVEYHCLGRFGY